VLVTKARHYEALTKADEGLRDVLRGLHNNITGVSWRWIFAGFGFVPELMPLASGDRLLIKLLNGSKPNTP
jgi:hypothetical protein